MAPGGTWARGRAQAPGPGAPKPGPGPGAWGPRPGPRAPGRGPRVPGFRGPPQPTDFLNKNPVAADQIFNAYLTFYGDLVKSCRAMAPNIIPEQWPQTALKFLGCLCFAPKYWGQRARATEQRRLPHPLDLIRPGQRGCGGLCWRRDGGTPCQGSAFLSSCFPCPMFGPNMLALGCLL